MAILLLFQKSSNSSEWSAEIQKNGVDKALNKFCREMPVTPQKVLKVPEGIRRLMYEGASLTFLVRSPSGYEGSARRTFRGCSSRLKCCLRADR